MLQYHLQGKTISPFSRMGKDPSRQASYLDHETVLTDLFECSGKTKSTSVPIVGVLRNANGLVHFEYDHHPSQSLLVDYSRDFNQHKVENFLFH